MSNEILKIIPTIQSVGLLESNLKNLKRKKKPIKNAVENIVGATMISETASFLS
jgi:hypothetical protein